MESVSYCQAERTKRRIAGCDRKYDNAEKRDNTADRSEDVLAHDADGCCCQRSVSRLKAQVVNAHGAGCPYHRDEAFQDHHIVECHAALFLALHRTGDDRRLGGVESGEDAAGHGDEEDRAGVFLSSASEDVLAELSVKGGADEKDHETNDECNHVVVPPCLFC